MVITKIHEPEQWRHYNERVRPLMCPDDPEPRAQRRFDRLRMSRDHERLYRCIPTGARTSRAMLPTPVA